MYHKYVHTVYALFILIKLQIYYSKCLKSIFYTDNINRGIRNIPFFCQFIRTYENFVSLRMNAFFQRSFVLTGGHFLPMHFE